MLLDFKKVKVLPAERKRLLDQLSNWDALHKQLTDDHFAGVLTPTMLSKMVKVEATSRRRIYMVNRLLGFYTRICRQMNEQRVSRLLAEG